MTTQRMVKRARFTVEVGLLFRRSLRNSINDRVAELRYQNPKATIHLTESKGWLDSTFIFVIFNIPVAALDALTTWLKVVAEDSDG